MTLPFHVGDHVSDDEDDDADDRTLLVVGISPKNAEEYHINDEMTVADYNPDYSTDAPVVEVCYPQRSDVEVSRCKTYAFPAERLSLVEPIHDIEADAEQEVAHE